ncbi:diacylglycerol kinase family enzyme [Dyadobacter jejuensis]|uniref:Diacylglycerol kinase family enzyme n=1 Tax=Dyadobacter jejuensis TaxID=1082580 RepID=A0A316ASP9_9BACT|nr:diacylglycerol kinase family protein [Dyadobacter jejuensis]PWJ59850.1 diacylglycerol kinase family enzyme [Dyadobacter jejuensis]
MDKPSFLFILNPNSGTSTGDQLQDLQKAIQKSALHHQSHAEVVFTESHGHAPVLVKEHLAQRPWKGIVAIGGDGTVNEVGSALVTGPVPLGILPMGSGNGLARHLGLPLKPQNALNRLFTGKPKLVDSALLNDIPFFCTAGIGFDAYVGNLFSQEKRRGLLSYMKVSFQSYWDYEPQRITLNGVAQDAFSITIANAGQYGNNAWIAPQASLQDGMLDICTIRPFPKWYGLKLVQQMFSKSLVPSRFIGYNKVLTSLIETKAPAMIHYDGEPLQLDTTRIEIKIRPSSLNIIC